MQRKSESIFQEDHATGPHRHRRDHLLMKYRRRASPPHFDRCFRHLVVEFDHC